MSNLLSSFLVAKSVDGHFQKVSVGRLFTFDAQHSLQAGKAFGMTEAEHYNICRAARWMFEETIRPSSVDMEGGWRVSLI